MTEWKTAAGVRFHKFVDTSDRDTYTRAAFEQKMITIHERVLYEKDYSVVLRFVPVGLRLRQKRRKLRHQGGRVPDVAAEYV